MDPTITDISIETKQIPQKDNSLPKISNILEDSKIIFLKDMENRKDPIINLKANMQMERKLEEYLNGIKTNFNLFMRGHLTKKMNFKVKVFTL
jgi:hypothetical protein